MDVLWPIVGMEQFGTNSNMLPAVPTSALCVLAWLYFPSWGKVNYRCFVLSNNWSTHVIACCDWGNVCVPIVSSFIMFSSDNGFLSSNFGFKWYLSLFQAFQLEKGWSFNLWLYYSFFSVFTGFFYGFCGKQQILLNWVYLRVSGSTLWVYGGLGRGLSTGLRLFVWGFLIKGFISLI